MAQCKKKCEDFDGCNTISYGIGNTYKNECYAYMLDKTRLANDDDLLFMEDSNFDTYTLRGKQKSF